MLADIRWNVVGDREMRGKEEVVSTCKETLTDLTNVTTTFTSFRVVPADHCVVVESRADYTTKGSEPSRIASCDIYDFADGRLAGITSFNVELPA